MDTSLRKMKKETKKVEYEALKDLSFAGGGPPPPPVPRDPIEEPVGIDTPEFPRPTDRNQQGKPPGALSLSTTEVIDLISEGEIEGISSGVHVFDATLGNTGYESAKFEPYVPTEPGGSIASTSGYLRSVYYNDVEILSKQGYFNFDSADFQFTPGNKVGESIALTTDDEVGSNQLQVIRSISERLFGPELTYKNTDESQESYLPEQMVLKEGEDDLGRHQANFYKILNKRCKSFKVNVKIGSLFKRELEGPFKYKEGQEQPKVGKGDTKGNTVEYRIDYRPYFSKDYKNSDFFPRDDSGKINQTTTNVKKETVFGRVAAGYMRETLVEVDTSKYQQEMEDPDFMGWEVAIYRSTFDSFSSSEGATTTVDSIVEIYEERYCYPNSAYVRSRFRADSFSALPKRKFLTRGIKVRVPNNYNTLLRTYGASRGGASISNGGDSSLDQMYDENGAALGASTEDWNGDWKRNSDGTIRYEWTDNPAWIFHDLITNPRYGLGKQIGLNNVDKWGLFEIAKYCDVMVPNGKSNPDGTKEGGEPRFTCNVAITNREDALNVINSFASIFRGLSFYQGGKLQASFDADKPVTYLFNNSNVLEGNFVYSNSSKKARATVVLVRYNDSDNYYKPTIEYVEDTEGIKKYGVQVRELTAFGTTSKSQAIRFGKYVLFTEALETQSVNFTAGLEGAYISPGQIISISDKTKGNYADFSINRRGGKSTRLDIESGGSDNLATGYLYLDASISGYVNTSKVAASDRFQLEVLTPPAYIDAINTSISDSSNASSYVKKPSVQKFSFIKSDVLETGTAYSGISNNHTKSVIKITGDLSSSTNVFDTNNFNVTGFTGLLYNEESQQINGTGFVEPKPDHFAWGVGFTGAKLNITPDIDLYKVVGVQEKQGNKFVINGIEHKPEKYDLIDYSTQNISPASFDFPGAATNFNSFVIPLTSNSRKIRYSFAEPSPNTDLAGFKIYVKLGAWDLTNDFNEDPFEVFPNSEYLRDFLPKGKTSSEFLPTEDGTYNFRIYSVNTYGKADSSAYLEGSVAVDGINLLMDMTVNSLSLVGDLDGGTNESAKKDGDSDFTTSDLQIQWQAGFTDEKLTAFAIPNDFEFRVTYRYPDQNYASPGNIILHEQTGISSAKFSDDLTMSENLAISVPAELGSAITPFRSFDVVVEAVDSQNRTSAGGSITRDGGGNLTSESTYFNAKGYDILYVNNSAPQSIRVSDRIGTNGAQPENCDNAVNANFCTDQWLEDDGTLNFVIEKDTNGIVTGVSDLSQAVFIVSKTYFDSTSISSKIDNVVADGSITSLERITKLDDEPTYAIVSQGLTKDEDYVFTVKTPFTDISSEEIVDEGAQGALTEVYVSVGFMDDFISSATEIEPTKKSLLRKINWATNTVKVGPRNAFLKDSLMYRAWIVMNVNWDSKDILDYQASNISEVAYPSHAANYAVRQQKVTHGKGGGTSYKNFTIQANRAGRSFTFKNPLPSSQYEIVIYYSPREKKYTSGSKIPIFGEGSHSPEISVSSKTRYGFTINNVSTGGYGTNGKPLKGCYFIGVLLGSNIVTNLNAFGTTNADATWLSDEFPYDTDRLDEARSITLNTELGAFDLNF